MPGGIRSDADFWRLLSERGIVQEPISERYGKGHLPIGEFSVPGRLASPYEGLIRDDEELLFDRSFFGMPRALRQGPPAHRGVFRSGTSCKPLRGADSRRRGTALRPLVLRHVPQRIEADRAASQDAAELRMGGHRARRLGPSLIAQQPHRSLHRLAGSGRLQLAAATWRLRTHRVRYQPSHAGQPGLVLLQPHGLVGDLLHGLLCRLERPARSDERA